MDGARGRLTPPRVRSKLVTTRQRRRATCALGSWEAKTSRVSKKTRTKSWRPTSREQPP